MKKTVYTYYQKIDELDEEYQKEILSICEESWRNKGWEFKVLSEKNVENSDSYSEFKKTILSYPTVNNYLYEYSCYMRWLAMAEIGGGILIDYDVFNLDLDSQDEEFFNHTGLTIYVENCPCVVSGSKEDYLSAVRFFTSLHKDVQTTIPDKDLYSKNFLKSIKDKPHTSDMYMICSGRIKLNKVNKVKNYPDIGKLIHCSNYNCLYKKLKLKKEVMSEFKNYKL